MSGHPWIHLLPKLPLAPLTFNYPLSDLTKKSINQLTGFAAIRTTSIPDLTQYRRSKYPSVTIAGFTTRLVLLLLRTNTTYPDQFCTTLYCSSPLWIAMLISNTLKILHPQKYNNEHIHPISPPTLIEYLPSQLLQQFTIF